MINNQLTDKRARLRKVAQDYQSTLSWYHENPDNPNAEQDCDEAAAAFRREIYSQEIDIIADLLDEIDELQERRKTTINSEPVAWSGWACQSPGRMPRLYGDKAIAELNFYPEQGERLLFLSSRVQPALVAPEIIPDALRDEIIDLCAGYEIGDQGAQEIWRVCRAAMLNGGKP